MPFLRFQLEKYIGLIPEKLFSKNVLNWALVIISPESQRLLEKKELLGFLKSTNRPYKGRKNKLGKFKDFFPKFYVFWENLCIQNFTTRIVLTYNKYLSKTCNCKVYYRSAKRSPA